VTKELEGSLSSLLGLGLLLGPLERSIGIARELLAGRHAALFGTRWSGLHFFTQARIRLETLPTFMGAQVDQAGCHDHHNHSIIGT